MKKNECTVWFDVRDADKIRKIKSFIPACDYNQVESCNQNEYGMVIQEEIIIKYRATTFVRYILDVFGA